MENDHLISWSEVKNLKVEHYYLKRHFTKSYYINEKPKRSIKTMGYYSLLFIENCLIPGVKFFYGLIFFSVIGTTDARVACSSVFTRWNDRRSRRVFLCFTRPFSN